MRDKIIQKLFPNQEFILSSNADASFSVNHPADNIEPLNFSSYSVDFLNGDIDLSETVSYYFSTFFPSAYSRKNLFFPQLLCSAIFGKNYYTKRKNMPSYLLAQTFYGEGVLKYNGFEYRLLPNDIFLIDCRNEHEYYANSNDGWGYRLLHFDGNSMPGYYIQIAASGNVKFTFSSNDYMDSFWETIVQNNIESKPNKEILFNRIMTDMITELLCQIPQYQTSELPDLIINIRNYIDNHFTQKITLDEIAEHCKISKYYMSRIFKKHLGQSIFSYVIDCRISLAQRMLRYSEEPIGTIAEKVGFEDHNGFYRAFMQREDLSPSAYRKYWHSF